MKPSIIFSLLFLQFSFLSHGQQSYNITFTYTDKTVVLKN